MSAIINAGENLVLERQVSIAQTKTQGGRRVSQKRGPTLYNLEVQVPAQRQNGTKFYSIEQEVINMEYGSKDFQAAAVSGQIGGNLTSERGLWTGTPQINGTSSNGTTVNIKTGLTAAVTGYARAFDYVQFQGSTKVYQVVSDVNSEADGTAIIQLNSPLVVVPSESSVVLHGGAVNFNFALVERPKTTYQPGEIIQYGTFVFEEVIKDVTRTTSGESSPPGTLSQQLFLPGTQPDTSSSTGYSGWVVSDGSGGSETILDQASVIIAGSGSISTTYSNGSDTLTISSTAADDALAFAIALG